MPDPSGFSWDDKLRRYRDPGGRLVSRARVRGALDSAIDAERLRIAQVSRRLQSGTAAVGDWQLSMEASLRKIHTASAALAAGGWAQATAADWATAGARLRGQYDYLRRFAGELESGLPLDGTFLARADMYGMSGTITYESVSRRRDSAAGYDEECRYLHASRSCNECIDYAARGWSKAGTLPLPTERCSCRTRCRCSLERRRSKSVPPAPKPSKVPRFGPSGATVRAAEGGPDLDELVAKARRILGGRTVTARDLASLAGAPDDATVEIEDSGFGASLRFWVSGPGYRAQRQLTTAPEGDDAAFVLIGRNAEHPARVKNEFFEVNRDRQGGGLGRRVFGRQVETARSLGVGEIRTEAARGGGLIGYKVWPRFGYDGPLKPSIRGELPESLRDAGRISDLMRTEEGRDWWADNGESIDLTFDLSPGSLSVRTWEAYLAEKAAVGGGTKQLGPAGGIEMARGRIKGTESADFDAADLAIADRVWDAIPVKPPLAYALDMGPGGDRRSASPPKPGKGGSSMPMPTGPRALHLMMRPGADARPLAALATAPLDTPDADRPKLRRRDGVAVIDVKGPVLPRLPKWYAERCEAVSLEHLVPMVYAAAEDPAIEAILLDFDSPGGLATGVPEAADAIFRCRRKKPIWAFASGECCSAGYYLASACSAVWAGPGSMIGSVGTRTVVVDDSEFWEEMGIRLIDVVATDSPDKVPDVKSPEGIALYQRWIDRLNDRFIADVARFRGVSESVVKRDYLKGWMAPAGSADAAPLIDGVDTFEGVMRRVRAEAGSRRESRMRGRVAAAAVVRGRLAPSTGD